MRRAFVVGCLLAIVLLVIGLITGNYQFFGNVLLVIGIISIIISGLLSGVFLTGPEIRANYYSETKEHRESRYKGTLITGIFSLPLLVAAAFLLLI